MKRKLNDYNLDGEYGIGYTHKGQPFYFDLEDYNKIKDISWHINSDGYVHGVVVGNKKISMHRLVMDAPEGLKIDHKHGKQTRNDNRKENLRIATNQENLRNCSIREDNTSGNTGISWHKNKKKWIAQIGVDSKLIYLGVFGKYEEAVQARKQAEQKYFGEWSYDNSQLT